MTMNATQVSMNVKGVNKTGKVFKEIAASAASVGKAAALFGAAAAGSAAVAFAATAKSLGHLSDVAMQASTSTKELTKLSSAMGVLGIKSQTPEALAMAFQRMTKSIGETGVGGFKKAIAAIAQMETAEKRSAAAMAVFGKSGLDFMPLIEGAAKNGISALEDVMAGMPGISDSAAQAGDDVGDSMDLMTNGAKKLWAEAVGAVSRMIDSQFAGGIREAAMKANAYIEYYTKAGWLYAKTFFNAWAATDEGIVGGFKNAVDNMLAIAGGFVVAMFKRVAAPLRKVFESVFNGWIYMYKRVFEGKESADMFVESALSIGGSVADYMKEPWQELATFVREDLKWFPDGTSVDLSGLRKNLEEQLAAATKAAAAVSRAAVGTVARESAEDTAGKVREAMKAAKSEFMDAGSYKAATMSIRSDYGKSADKTVRVLNAVKAVNEKIQKATEATATALANIPAA